MVGHNPGLHGDGAPLTASGDVEARERLNEPTPTDWGFPGVIDFAGDDWEKYSGTPAAGGWSGS